MHVVRTWLHSQAVPILHPMKKKYLNLLIQGGDFNLTSLDQFLGMIKPPI
jgi:hypothetical protein